MSVDCLVSTPLKANGRRASQLNSCSRSSLGLASISLSSLTDFTEYTTAAPQLTDALANKPSIAVEDFPFDYDSQHQADTLNKPATSSITFSLPADVHRSVSGLASLISTGDRAANERAIATTAFAMTIADHCGKNDILLGQATTEGRTSVLHFAMADSKALPDIFGDINVQLELPYTSADIESAVLDGKLNEQYAEIIISPYGFPLAHHKPALGCELHRDRIVWYFDTARFHKDTVGRIHERFVNLLHAFAASAVADPSTLEKAPRFLHTLPENELSVLRRWEVGLSRSVCAEPIGLHHLVERWANQTPEKIAITDADGRTLTYGQLSTASDNAAGRLHAMGCQPGHRIAVLLPRSLELIIAVMGILKCGAAYVPLDPAYPGTRIQYILDDAACSAIVSNDEYASQIPADYQGLRILTSDLSQTNGAHNPHDASERFDQSSLLTVLYTSGTTGNPKGVAIEHRNAHVFMSNTMWDPVTPDDTWAQMSNPCFIGSFNDIWLPLARGASTAIIPKDALLDTVALSKTFKDRGVTCLFLTPKLLEMYADCDPGVFDGLNLIQFAGEAVRADAVMKLAGRPRHLQHLYGCTERTGCISGYTIPAGGLPDAVAKLPRLPIGRPVDNTQAYVLDKDMMRVPIGCTGELYIGGPQITRGYLNREEATREKFIANPFDGGRMYRTGDLARWLPDGSGLDLLGRVDNMVKLRGYRIELGEIEAQVMAANAGATAAVATTHDITPGNTVLAVYVAPESVDTRALLDHMRAKLPEFMVPRYICAIRSIPLTHNGKVDRRALPNPAAQSHAVGGNQGPMTANEKRVAALYSNVLGIPADAIGAHGKFAELGGTSFMAMRLLSMLREACPAVQMIDLVEYNTPALLAQRLEALEQAKTNAHPDELVQFARGREESKERPVFVVHGGSGLVQWLAPIGAQMTVRPLYGVQMTPEAVEAAKASDDYFMGLCEHYAAGIRMIQPHGPYTIGGISLGSLIALGIASVLEKQGETVDRVIAIDMPAVKFDKRKAYATATCHAEKAPFLLATSVGSEYATDLPEFKERVAQLERDLDDAILSPAPEGEALSEDRAFVQMAPIFHFLVDVGMPAVYAELYLDNMVHMSGLFIDPVEHGLYTSADIDLAIAGDNRLIAHTLRVNGHEDMLDDYGWGRVTSGNVTPWTADGDHLTMIGTEEGITLFAACFDRL